MKNTTALLIFVVGVCVPSLSQNSDARTLLVKHGTVLKAATTKDMSSETALKGEIIELALTRPLVIDGVTLLPVGAVILGKVTHVKKVGHLNGDLKWTPLPVALPDGSELQLDVCYEAPNYPNGKVPEFVPDSEFLREGKAKTFLDFLAAAPLTVPLAIASGLDAVTNRDALQFWEGKESTVGLRIRKDVRIRPQQPSRP